MLLYITIIVNNIIIYYMSQKSWPISNNNLLYKICQHFLDILRLESFKSIVDKSSVREWIDIQSVSYALSNIYIVGL